MKNKILSFILCFLITKAMGQNLKIQCYDNKKLTPGLNFKTSLFDEVFEMVYVNGILIKNKDMFIPANTADLPTSFAGFGNYPPQLVIVSEIGSNSISSTQVDALVAYVKQGGILIASIEKTVLSDLGTPVIEYLTNALFCNNLSAISNAEDFTTIIHNTRYKFHPDDGVLFLHENGANTMGSTGTYDVVSGVPTENFIIPSFENGTISNCNQKKVIEYIVPAYPGFGVACPNNSCDIKGFAIVTGEVSGPFTRINSLSDALDKNYVKLIYDFLYDPAAMQRRYAWTNNKGNNNVDCPPNVPTGYSNAVLTTSIPTPVKNTALTLLNNTCPATTVNLLSAITSSTPSNTELRWFTNPSHYGEAYTTPLTATTGTYYAFYYDLTENCYSLASAAVLVETTACNPCTDNFKNANPTVLSGFYGTVTGAHPAGLYWIKSDITIDAPTSFENAEILIEPNVTITIKAKELKFTSSHLYTCDGRWNGIVVSKIGRIVVDGVDDISTNTHTSSLIEDAETAITFDADVTGATGPEPPILFVNNTIFNRNNVGIKISDPYYYSIGPGYNTGALNYHIYNCYIKNSLFTCRDIGFRSTRKIWDNFKTVANYPSSGYPNCPNSYTAPYVDDAVYLDQAPKAFLKDPVNLGQYTTQKPFAGIVLSDLNYVNTNNERVCVKIGEEGGDSHPDPTIFDNLQYGIKATDANFIARNCSFQKPIGVGIGIYADASSENLFYNQMLSNNGGKSFANINKVEINTPNGTPSNAFYDMNRAVEIIDIDDVEVSGCDIRSNQNINSLSDNGKYGIHVGSNSFARIEINKNHIYNIRNAITYGGGAEGGRNYFGILNIKENEIDKEFSTTYPMPNGFVENAITAGAFFESRYTNPVPLNVHKNKIANAYNGIWLSGFISKNFKVLENEIHVAEDATIAPDGKHYGIKIEGGSGGGLQYELDNLGNYVLDPNGVPIAFGNKNENLVQDNKV